ncbi:MAG: alpha/beta fold hydrolase [Chloroflexota bacterium]|nr:alpha/beta fold hydrolase [Chloroflexota bacterium]
MEEGTNLNLAHMVRVSREGSGERGSPGLLMLHGRGADEADLMGLEAALDPRLTVISARAPFRLGYGFAWYGMAQVGSPEDETLRASLGELQEFVERVVPAYNLDPSALFVMGFSQGGVMSSALALTVPERVRGVVMHSGYVPVESGLDLKLEQAKGKPFFVAHGMYDEVIPVRFGRHANDYLTGIGAEVTYQEYPIGHSISEESLDDLSEWLSRTIDDGP